MPPHGEGRVVAVGDCLVRRLGRHLGSRVGRRPGNGQSRGASGGAPSRVAQHRAILVPVLAGRRDDRVRRRRSVARRCSNPRRRPSNLPLGAGYDAGGTRDERGGVAELDTLVGRLNDDLGRRGCIAPAGRSGPRGRTGASRARSLPPPFGAVLPPDPGERRRPIVSRATLVVARPTRFVNTARYSLPVSDALAVNVYVTRWAPRMLAHVRPRLTERCHCVLGAGLPEAAAVKPARRPAAIVTLRGWTITSGRRRPPRARTIGAGPGRNRIIGPAVARTAVR